MKWRWISEEPDENGDFELVIENGAGNRVSTFKGKTKDDIINGLATSQVQANRRIGDLLKPDKATPPEPKQYTDAERLNLSTGITDPSKVVETISSVAADLNKQRADRDAYYAREAAAFVQATPEYFPSKPNQDKLFARLEADGLDLTRNNLTIVFDKLLGEAALDLWPDDNPRDTAAAAEDAESASTPPVAAPKPTHRGSGLRNSDANASKPPPPKPKPLVTRADIEKMSRVEYNEKLRDPAFRKAVDALA